MRKISSYSMSAFAALAFALPAAAGTTEPDQPDDSSTAYVTTSFVVPFEVTLPTWAARQPVEERPSFVAWEGIETERAIRFLVPAYVYPPGETAPVPVPDDYVAYLLAQSDHGAVFEDIVETTVDGRPATVLTATAARNLDDSIGCTEEDDLVTDCFGLLADLVLRIAILDSDQGPLLVWVRDTRGSGDEPEYETFDAMLSSLHFRPEVTTTSAAPDTTAAEAGDPRLPEGDYRTTELTGDQLITAGVDAGFTPEDVQSAVEAALPGLDSTIQFGLRLQWGSWIQYVIVNDGPAEVGWRGTYDIVDDATVNVTDPTGEDGTRTFAYHFDGEQLTLDLVDCPPCDQFAEMIETLIYESAPYTLQ
jgi:hypothetical protein